MWMEIAANQSPHGAANSAQSREADLGASSQSLRLPGASQSLPWCADQWSCLLLQSLRGPPLFEAPSLPLRAAGSGHFVCLLDVSKASLGVFWRHIVALASQARTAIQYRW